MKIKSTPAVKALAIAVFSILVVSGSAAIAREIFDGSQPAPVVKKSKKHHEAPKEEYSQCPGTLYPIAPKERKRLDSLVGWSYEPLPAYTNKEAYVIKEDVLVSDYPKKGYVLDTNGKYILQK